MSGLTNCHDFVVLKRGIGWGPSPRVLLDLRKGLGAGLMEVIPCRFRVKSEGPACAGLDGFGAASSLAGWVG